jgi:AAA domain-containing protein
VVVVAAKDYSDIARQRITHPSNSDRAPRVLVYGRNKKGKTRFCTTAGNVLILDPEEGTDHETKADPDVWKITHWEDINDAYMFLKLGPGKAKSPRNGQPYDWVAIDGLTRITNMALKWVMNQEEERNLERKPGQVGKQDYGRSGEMVKGMLHNFHSLRHLGVIISAQERMREVESSEEDDEALNPSFVFVPDLPAGVRSSVNSIVDVIGRIYTVRGSFKKRVREKSTGEIKTIEYDVQRRMWIGDHNSYDTGYRSEYVLPDFIPEPSVPKLVKVMREGKVA